MLAGVKVVMTLEYQECFHERVGESALFKRIALSFCEAAANGRLGPDFHFNSFSVDG